MAVSTGMEQTANGSEETALKEEHSVKTEEAETAIKAEDPAITADAMKKLLPPNPTPRPKGKLLFSDLPVDIKTLIIQHIFRPTDMVSLCLTSKQLHQLTVRQLYHEVTLEVGSPTDRKLNPLMNPRNIGIPHIRKLDVYLADVLDKCNQIQQAHFAIGMIIELLPEDILEKFSWHPWSPFSADNLLLLYKKQRNLRWLEGISLDRDVLAEVEALPDLKKIFGNVRKLGLYPDSREVLNYCGFLIKHTNKIEKITLHSSFDESDDENGVAPISNRELNDSSTEPGLITRALFGHMMKENSFENCTKLELKDLTMQKISLRYAAETYCRIIDFRKLKALRIFGCSGADALLAELSKSSKLPTQLETLEFKHDDNQENDALNALDGFLCLIQGLKVLTMDVCFAKQLPASAGITRHAKTLTELIVHASRGDGVEEEELVYSVEDFEKICKACTNIEQLSIAFPPTCIVRSFSDSFSSFENALGDLANLVTLNITTWPTNSPSSSRLPRKTYEILLQALAQTGFDNSIKHAQAQDPPQSSKLGVIAFGASDKVYDREDSKNQVIFVKGKQIDALGKESPLAVPIGWCLRKYVEPRSEVLEFSLARSVRPPTREPPQSDDSD